MARVRSRKRVQYQNRRRRRRRNTYRYLNKKSKEILTNSEIPILDETACNQDQHEHDEASCTIAEEVPSTTTDVQSTTSPNKEITQPAKRLKTAASEEEKVASGASAWIDFNAEICLSKIPYVVPVFDVWRWCRQIWTQSFESIKDTVFPYRLYQRELQLTKDKVQHLEEELKSLKNNHVSFNECKCPCRSSTPVFLPQCSTATYSTSVLGTTFPLAVPPPPPPPPPVAPPPPPPPPPPSAPVMNPVQFKSKAKKGPVQKARNQSDSGPLVSMSDLKGVKLRRVKSVCDENNMDMQARISKEAVSLRRTLKKVSLMRSPGGTPMRSKKHMETGTGLTPLMTKALRSKFKSIRTPSPVGKPFDFNFPKKRTTPSQDPIQSGNLFDSDSST